MSPSPGVPPKGMGGAWTIARRVLVDRAVSMPVAGLSVKKAIWNLQHR